MENTSLGIGGVEENFKLYEGQDIASWLETTFENKPEDDNGNGEGMEVDT